MISSDIDVRAVVQRALLGVAGHGAGGAGQTHALKQPGPRSPQPRHTALQPEVRTHTHTHTYTPVVSCSIT